MMSKIAISNLLSNPKFEPAIKHPGFNFVKYAFKCIVNKQTIRIDFDSDVYICSDTDSIIFFVNLCSNEFVLKSSLCYLNNDVVSDSFILFIPDIINNL